MSEDQNVDTGIETENTPQPTQAEVEAQQFGWVPKEHFKGNPEEWRDAETFLKRGKEINGFLRKDLEKIQRQLFDRDATIAELRETMQEFSKYHKETEKRAYERAITELKAERAAAIEQGDGQKVNDIDDKLDDLKEARKTIEKPEPKKPEPTAMDAAFTTWAKENSWYGTDKKLSALADGVADRVRLENPHLQGKDFLDAVTEVVKELEPEKFENPARVATVSTSSDSRPAPTAKGNKKTYANLPPEAKAACDKFVKQGILTAEQYVKEYDWE